MNMENTNKNFNGLLVYLINNCIFVYDQLYRINIKLNQEIVINATGYSFTIAKSGTDEIYKAVLK